MVVASRDMGRLILYYNFSGSSMAVAGSVMIADSWSRMGAAYEHAPGGPEWALLMSTPRVAATALLSQHAPSDNSLVLLADCHKQCCGHVLFTGLH